MSNRFDSTAPNIGDVENEYILTQETTDVNTKYLLAVENMDMEMAEKLVDEAAKNAGYTRKMYHGTQAQFTVFDKKKAKSSGFYGRYFSFGSNT